MQPHGREVRYQDTRYFLKIWAKTQTSRLLWQSTKALGNKVDSHSLGECKTPRKTLKYGTFTTFIAQFVTVLQIPHQYNLAPLEQ